MSQTQDFIEQNRDRFLEELIDWLKIPSVSADPAHADDVRKAAEWLRASLEMAGADACQLIETPGYPVVYAEKIIDPDKPTVLMYGHYDVQPPDPIELWDSPPFEPVLKDEKIFARGACDDKGQAFMHIKAFEAMLSSGELACNVKFMIEGEEEVGSSHLEAFLREQKDRLKADVVLVSDTALVANDVPSITTGLRGMSYVEVHVQGPSRDLHSGIYGGAVANPIQVLSKMIDSLIDDEGKITVEGFYDKVQDVSAEDRSAMASVPFDLDAYKSDLSVDAVSGEDGYSTVERASIRPSLDVNGIWGGYIGEGAKTVLPAEARAKISMRLVPDQQPEEITELFSRHFKKIAPDTVKVSVTAMHGGDPVVVPTDFPAYQAAAQAMEKTFGKKPVPMRSGGSIPIVALFEEILGLKTILMGFGLDSDAIHSPNEHFGVFNFFKGIETIPEFYQSYAEIRES